MLLKVLSAENTGSAWTWDIPSNHRFLKRGLAVITAVCLLAAVCGCMRRPPAIDSAALVAIGSSDTSSRTVFHYLDGDLNPIGTSRLRKPGVSFWNEAVMIQDGWLYLLPQGDYWWQKETAAGRYHLETGEYQEFDFGLVGMLQLALAGSCLFAVNNQASHTLSRYEMETGTVSHQDLEYDIFKLRVIDGQLYAVGMQERDEYLLELSAESMSVTQAYALGEFGSPWDMAAYGNRIYLTNMTTSSGSGIGGDTITVFDRETGGMHSIRLEVRWPQRMAVSGSRLYVTHGQGTLGEEKTVTVVDLDTEAVHTFHLEHSASYIQAADDAVYLLDDSGIVYRYETSPTEIRLAEQCEVSIRGVDYLSGLILYPQPERNS